jgi:acyl-CoA thioesterase-1
MLAWFRTRLGSGGARSRSYGKAAGAVQFTAAILFIALAIFGTMTKVSAEPPIKIVAFGDSLTAGFGLPVDAAFPPKLQRALRDKGIEVELVNAGVSGDTASGGLARLDWSLPEGTDAVILELGANDALRGLDPKVTQAALDTILRRLKERRIEVLLAGMQAPRNFGPDYAAAFDAVFPQLASAHNVLFYPFFLEGVAADAKLNQPDGLHPTAAGVDAIVAAIMPKVEELVTRVRAKRNL